MNLKAFYNRTVYVTTDTGLTFLGKVSDYFYSDNNENGEESIVVDTLNGSAIEFYEKDIASIGYLDG